MKKAKVAIIGVGAISGIYLKNITTLFSHALELAGVYDLVREKAEQAAESYDIPTIYPTIQAVFDDPGVDIVLNLTRPFEHFGVSMAALEAGKHVYTEKPLAATLDEGRRLVEAAAERGLLLGGAPDTFLGAGIQTCRRLIDDGYIGTPIGGAAFMICHGHESWHPDPAFYYQHGGGPLMDMGPYYLTAMVNLLGGVRRVSGFTKAAFPTRTVTSQPKYGQAIEVQAPTWINGLLEFECGATVTLFTTFDVWYDTQARFEIYGTEGTLLVPDPNGFGGPVRLLRPEDGAFKEMPLLTPYKEDSRGLGLADMAAALDGGRPFRAGAQQVLHVLEIMEKIEESGRDAQRVRPIEAAYRRQAGVNE